MLLFTLNRSCRSCACLGILLSLLLSIFPLDTVSYNHARLSYCTLRIYFLCFIFVSLFYSGSSTLRKLTLKPPLNEHTPIFQATTLATRAWHRKLHGYCSGSLSYTYYSIIRNNSLRYIGGRNINSQPIVFSTVSSIKNNLNFLIYFSYCSFL